MKKLYFIIRIPKSGSQSMRDMVKEALHDSQYFRLPFLAPDPGTGITLYERLRLRRRTLKGFWRRYRTFREAAVWETISKSAKEGDMISGHLRYGSPQLPDWDLQCITLLRNPVDRLISEYNYFRQGYLERSLLHKVYVRGLLQVAGTHSLSDYIRYLHEHRGVFGNPATSFIIGADSTADPFEFMRRNYFHFGVLEEMECFAAQLSEKLHRPVTSAWINKTRKTVDHRLTEDDQALLDELLDQDIPLYQKTVAFIRGGKEAQPAHDREV